MTSPSTRVVCLSAGMAVVGATLSVYSTRWGAPVGVPLHLPWWVFVAAYLLNNMFVVHFEIREEAHSFTLSELPLVLGCFCANPIAVIVGRMIGEALFLGLRRRQAPLKLTFNLSMFLFETASAVVIFHLLAHGASPLNDASWLAVFAAVGLADVVSLLTVSMVIRWHGARSRVGFIVGVAAVTALVNVSLSILAAIVLWVNAVAMLLFAVVAAVTVFANRGYATLKQRYASLQLLYDFTKAVGASMAAEAVMDKVLLEARNLLRAGHAEVIILASTSGQVTLRQASGDRLAPAVADSGEATGPTPTATLWQEVIAHGKSRVVPRWNQKPLDVEFCEHMGVRDALVAPLLSEGTVIGTITVANRLGEVSTFDDQDLRLFETLANHASVAFENGRLIEQLRREADERRYEALHDPLTGLPNRSLFIQQVHAAIHASTTPRSAVMLMDLDRFKEINDTLGHHSGDLVLQQVAHRVLAVFGEHDTVARLGGDEFAILVPDIDSRQQAENMAGRILETLREPIAIDELSLQVGASIGIAISPEHGGDPATLLQRADVAMYEAKANHAGMGIYSAETDRYSPRRLSLAGELSRAIEAGDILVYHQPKARLSDGEVIGTEALVRWRHRLHGLIPPDDFIPVAEQTGLISTLTVHVLRSALTQCAQWRRSGHDLGVAVNLAVRSLLDTDLAEVVQRLLSETGVPADHLTLELTESSIMADPARTIGVLEQLANIGVHLSVDDFGTGYSSLAYLQRLPVQEVKVDKSFVFRMAIDPNDAMIVQSIIELGHNLNLRVVAEGVEDRVSWDRLAAIGCDIAQGYYLSKPVPAIEVTRWLNQRKQLKQRDHTLLQQRTLGARSGHLAESTLASHT